MKIKRLLILLKDPKSYIYIYNRIFARIKSLPCYAWYVTRVDQYKKLKRDLAPYYFTNVNDDKTCAPYVVSIFDGKILGGGLADRLRGILSTYYIAKKTGREFKLFFKSPFEMENYLIPNMCDWRCNKSDLNYNLEKTKLIILDTTQDSAYQRRKQEEWLYNQICHTNKQCHIYSNALFSYDYDYKNLFAELFKPTDALQQTLNYYNKILGESYISISCRFLNLLNDFNETYGIKEPLTQTEKQDLLKKVTDEIVRLHTEYPGHKILCNSDSITFLAKMKELDFTYVVPGEITHIDGVNKRDDYKMYEKTFVDFFLIAQASHIFLLKTGKMHLSGYPYAASKLFDRPFKIVEF